MTAKPSPFAIELTPELIIRAYRAGIFPMAEDAHSPDLFWVSPEHRGVMPLNGLHISHSLRKRLRSHPYAVRVDTDFTGIIDGCAAAGPGRQSTWINATIRRLYGELYERGLVHTVEVWAGDRLVGGLYGLALGAAFFGESMFHRETDASKIALVHLVHRLRAGDYQLLDMQFLTDHLQSLGGAEIPRELYELQLADAMRHEGDFFALDRGVKAS